MKTVIITMQFDPKAYGVKDTPQAALGVTEAILHGDADLPDDVKSSIAAYCDGKALVILDGFTPEKPRHEAEPTNMGTVWVKLTDPKKQFAGWVGGMTLLVRARQPKDTGTYICAAEWLDGKDLLAGNATLIPLKSVTHYIALPELID